MSQLSHARLLELLAYDPQTGVFIRLVANRRWKAGEPVGSKNADGYVVLKIAGVKHYAHRLAWFYVTGSWPDQNIDHIDGKKDNNR